MIGKYLKNLSTDILIDLKFVWSVILESLKLFGKNFGIIIVYSIVSVFILIVIALFSGMAQDIKHEVVIPTILFFTIIFVQSYTTLGFYKFIFTLKDSEYYEFEFSQILPHIRMIFNFIKLWILFAVLVVTFDFFIIGVFLKGYSLIQDILKIAAEIVFAYLALRYMFFIAFIVDDLSGSIESLRQSFNLTRSNIFKVILILAFFITIIALPIYGIVYYDLKFLVLTLIFLYPFINIVLALTYRQLVHDANNVDDILLETV
ncbi:MAG: hypothetical protein ABIN91_18625 [Mucilaginibacter sp.]|uniref:hypothetical protein n=1 Tax=Mucilaginibacter sp. TaxID=1882438 RepID=UPI003266A639